MERQVPQAPEVQAVPLSENEQRQLDAIERGLLADDPKFAATVRSSDLRRYYRRRLVRASLLFVVGLVLMVCFLITPVLGIIGFVFMFVAALLAASAFKRLKNPSDARFGKANASPGRSSTPRQGWRERAEERFRRRFDDRG